MKFNVILLGDLVTIKGGKRLPKGKQLQKEKNKHPYIRVTDMDGRYLSIRGLEYVPESVFPTISRYIVEENDLLISIVGTIGLVTVIDEKLHLASQTENTAKLSGLNTQDALFLYYYLVSDFGQEEIRKRTVGAVQAKLPLYNIKSLPVFWPDSLYRKKVVSLLDCLDTKIEKNHQINESLEAMAQAIFKSWFVDFDPVKAKIKAKERGGDEATINRAAMAMIASKTDAELETMAQESPEDYQNLLTIASHFPDEMEESELGLIPKGWEVTTLGEEYNITMGQSPKGESYNEEQQGTLFFQGRAEFGWRYPTARLYTTDPKRMAKKGDVLMSVRAPVGDFNIALEDCCIGRGLSALRHRTDSQTFSFYQLQSLKLELDRYNGEGTVFGSINQNNLKNIKIILPNELLIVFFINKISVFDEIIKNNSVENFSLIGLRDALLPKLLSGEIEV